MQKKIKAYHNLPTTTFMHEFKLIFIRKQTEEGHIEVTRQRDDIMKKIIFTFASAYFRLVRVQMNQVIHNIYVALDTICIHRVRRPMML